MLHSLEDDRYLLDAALVNSCSACYALIQERRVWIEDALLVE